MNQGEMKTWSTEQSATEIQINKYTEIRRHEDTKKQRHEKRSHIITEQRRHGVTRTWIHRDTETNTYGDTCTLRPGNKGDSWTRKHGDTGHGDTNIRIYIYTDT